MIRKHEIPILEFDDSPQTVIMPTHEDLDLDLPGVFTPFQKKKSNAMRTLLERKKLANLFLPPKPILFMS